MAKQVLGRNLEALLENTSKTGASGDRSAPAKPAVSSGVRSLMRGHQPALSVPPSIAPAGRPVVPGWYLFAGDILLVALALIIVGKTPHPLTWKSELFCAGAVVLGGCLALLALCTKE